MQLQLKMPENCRNNVFTSKQTTNKAPSTIFRGLQVGTKVRPGVWKAKAQHHRLMEHFQPVKTNNKVCLVYLECQLRQDRCA